MEPVSMSLIILIKAAIAHAAAVKGAALVALAILTVVLLTFEEVVDWFTDRQALKESDQDHIAFTLQEKLADGQYTTVQGIFNKRTHAIPAVRTIQSQKVDAKLAAIHAIHDVALYS